MFNGLRQITVILFCYIIITVIEYQLCYAFEYDPGIGIMGLFIAVNFAFAGFLTEYLICTQ
jgi:hypothetical protein